ncbi:hypothetical protein CKAH01_11696 [Colletotrichum kahawae]|uniref:Uncharacterized protein n=1 Tax=Colletotrichum kahawae TaxID=34407 RepID=A0AAD9YU42_COLKA|nr:hypothetical protein CKAH01_11696 [Colletotrichum kahawae]
MRAQDGSNTTTRSPRGWIPRLASRKKVSVVPAKSFNN